MRDRRIDCIEHHDLLALVSGLGDQFFGLVEIALAGQCFRPGVVRHRCAAGKKGRAELPILLLAGICDHEIDLVGGGQYRLAHFYIVERRVQVVEAQRPHGVEWVQFGKRCLGIGG
jgi:hypothetical protein